jgi:hypothetical protein
MKKAEINPDAGKQADQAKEIFDQIAPMLKDAHANVVGAVLGAMLAGYIGAHDPSDRNEAVDRVLLLASKIVGDIDRQNGIATETEGGVEFQFKYDDDVREQMETDPKLAEYVKDTTSRVRQALSDHHAGKYSSIDEAMRAIGLSEVDPDDLEEMQDRIVSGRKLS